MDVGRYDGHGSRSPQWWPSRYGPDDELGAGNELTPERLMAALGLPREGRVIELAQILEDGVPLVEARTFHQLILAHEAIPSAPGGSDATGYEEHVTQCYHLGCHVDGLGHLGIDGHYYNGRHHSEFYAPTGLKKYGMEKVRPWVTRGVCLDVAALEGVRTLEAGFVVTAEHLERACERQGVEVGAGDAVLIHTGWGDLWMEDDRYGGDEPGPGWEASHWLTDRRVSMVGADNWAFEVIPFEQPDLAFVCHQHLLAETGTHIVENLRTRELVDGSHWEFLFIMVPNKVRGATGSMVAPLAIV